MHLCGGYFFKSQLLFSQNSYLPLYDISNNIMFINLLMNFWWITTMCLNLSKPHNVPWIVTSTQRALTCHIYTVPWHVTSIQSLDLSHPYNALTCHIYTMPWLVTSIKSLDLSHPYNPLTCHIHTIPWLVTSIQCLDLSHLHNALTCHIH